MLKVLVLHSYVCAQGLRVLTLFLVVFIGQWCHTFCTYCFRWAQFTAVGSPQAFQSYDANMLASYLRKHTGIVQKIHLPTIFLKQSLTSALYPKNKTKKVIAQVKTVIVIP